MHRRVLTPVLALMTSSLVLAAVTLPTTPAFAQAPAVSAKPVVDNDTLEDTIEKKWEADAALKGVGIDVSVADGVATLTGDVPTAALKSRAARLAKVTGITKVENQITVGQPGTAEKMRSGAEKAADKTGEALGTAAGKTRQGVGVAAKETKKGVGVAADETKKAAHKTGEVFSDTWITTKVKSKFVGVDALKHSHIDVTTRDHIVTLTGTVASEAGRERAIAIVKATDGVKDVVDKLTIAPGKTE